MSYPDSPYPSTMKDPSIGESTKDSNDSFDTSSKFGNRGPDAEVWQMYVSEAERRDIEAIDRWDRSTENFILFTTLYSAILTAFVVLSVTSLQTDYTQTTTEALTIVSAQLFVLTNGGGTAPPAYQLPQFSPATADLWTNALWIISLTISLLATVTSMLVKQWLLAYRADLPLAQQDRARLRHFRYLGATRWYMSTIIEILPIAMHVSVIVFLGGFVVYLSERNIVIAYLVLAIAIIGTLMYIFVAIAPLIWLECPFVSPVTTGFDSVFSWLVQGVGWILSRIPGVSRKVSNTLASWGRGSRRALRIRRWLKETKNTDRLDTLALGWLQDISYDRQVNMAVFLAFVGWRIPNTEAQIIAPSMTRGAEHWIRQILRYERRLSASTPAAVELVALSGWSKANFWMGPVRKAARDMLSSYETFPVTSVFTRFALLFYATRFFNSRAGNLDSQDAERAADLFIDLMPNRDIPTFDFTLLLGFFHSRALFKPGDVEDKACIMVRDALRKRLASAQRRLPFIPSACAYLRAFERPPDLMKYADSPAAVSAPPLANYLGDEFMVNKLLSTARTFETRAAASTYAINNFFHPTKSDKPRLGWAFVKELLKWFAEVKYLDTKPPWRTDRTALPEDTHVQPALDLLESCVAVSFVRRNALSVPEVITVCVLLGAHSKGAERLLLDKNGYAHEVITMKYLRPLTAAGARDTNLAHLVTKCLNHVFGQRGSEYSGPLRKKLTVIHTHWFKMIHALFAQDSAIPDGHPLLDLASKHVAALSHLDNDLVMRSGVLEVLHGRIADLSSATARRISELVEAERLWQARHAPRLVLPRREHWSFFHSAGRRRNTEVRQTEDPELGLAKTEKGLKPEPFTPSITGMPPTSPKPPDAEKPPDTSESDDLS